MAAARFRLPGPGLRAVSSAAAEHIPASVPQTGARLTFSDRPLPGRLPLHRHARAGTRRCLSWLPVPAAAPNAPVASSLPLAPWPPGCARGHWSHGSGAGAAPGITVRWWSGPAGYVLEMPVGSMSPVPNAGGEHEGRPPWSPPAAAMGARCRDEPAVTCCGPWSDGHWGRWRKRRSCSASLHKRLRAGTDP